ncbi:MAG: response regulator transcription factor, partial [Gemmatimonadota bacterium]
MTTDATLADLTPREREVMEALADGDSFREAGQRLGISQHTVSAHVQHVKRKTGIDGDVRRLLVWYVGARPAS